MRVYVCVRARTHACRPVTVGVSAAGAIVKRPAFPLYLEDGRCTNFLYHYVAFLFMLHNSLIRSTMGDCKVQFTRVGWLTLTVPSLNDQQT